MNVDVSLFYEPDINNEPTAIAFVADDKIRRKLRNLPLALKNVDQGINKNNYKKDMNPV